MMVVKPSTMKLQPGKKQQVPTLLHNAVAPPAAASDMHQDGGCPAAHAPAYTHPYFDTVHLSQLQQAFSTCTLKELCPEDKQKVAKLVKQVRRDRGLLRSLQLQHALKTA
jgi:hypothetical protein